MPHPSYNFTHALVRRPPRSVLNGIRAENRGDPDFGRFDDAHRSYVGALRQAGLTVAVEPPLEDYPDSVFVEDAALCLAGQAIILRPGDERRFGEREHARAALTPLFGTTVDLPAGGFVDGGDILLTDDQVLIGLSSRTDRAGVGALQRLVEPLGFALRILDTPPDLLHFKTGCGLLDEETIFCVRALAESGCFDGFRTIDCPAGEESAANLIRVNDAVFVATAYPRTQDLLDRAGYKIVPIDTSEAEKIDGGLSCMSLRFALG